MRIIWLPCLSSIGVHMLNNMGVFHSEDSMGNTEVLQRGDIQMTSAGTGIRHSEKCHGPNQVHFLQIWAIPDESKLSPKYYTRFAFSFSFPLISSLSSLRSPQSVSLGA